jgi:hypothetical protein
VAHAIGDDAGASFAADVRALSQHLFVFIGPRHSDHR